ncbi:MAG: C10 family peptidase [Prevotella sp.]|nr:C10 family peptidase [Prevotella sp.]
MKKSFYITMMALLLSGSAIANPITTDDARQKAASFLKKQASSAQGPRRSALQNPQLTEAQAFGEALHVFNIAGNNGFVIVSGDDRTEPILGYVDGGQFDLNQMPDAMRFWLEACADQISNGNVALAPRRTERAAVEPTCITHWDQTDPFDSYILDDYPEQAQYYGNNLMTGCVATAMAQAMYTAARNYKAKHGDWPAIATHKIPGYKITETKITSTGWEMPELPEYIFDWANMRTDNYSPTTYTDITDEQKKAVGKLMQYCGRSMKMEYDKVNSASIAVYVAPRLYDCLNMSKFVQSVDRAYYDSQDWEDMMYKEVSEGRSVVYSSNVGPTTSSEGHCFILDGYKDGLWHINWGWGKELAELNGQPKADGYFSLSVMQPMAGGAGAAGVTDAQYKYLQQAIIGISYDDPDDGVSALNFYWNGKNVYTSSIGGWGAYNVLGAAITYEEGWAIRSADGTISDNIWNKTTEHEYPSIGVNSGTTAYYSDMTLPTEDGDYDIVHISREKGTTEWHASYGTDKNYVTITIADGKVTKAVAHPVEVSKDCLEVTSLDFIGDMEANKNNTVKVVVNNTGDDFFGTLGLYYNTGTSVESTKNVSFLATVKPGETTHEFIVNLPKGEYNIWLIANPVSYPSASSAFYSGKMLIGFGADANKVQVGNLKFENETSGTVNAKSVNGQLSPINGSFDVENKAANTYSKTYYVNVETQASYYTPAQVVKTIEVPVSVEPGKKETIEFSLGVVEGLNASTTYVIRVYQKDGSDEVEVGKVNLKLAAWFRYWLADGTEKEAAEPTYYDKLPEEAKSAIAVDCRGLSSTSYMDDIANTNCLFYITADQKPSSSWNPTYGRCLVIDGVAESLTIDATYPFYAPEAFTAKEISFVHKFAKGNNNDGNGWETIVLPFEVNSVKNGNKNLKWFKSANEKRCHFWLMELTGASADALVFDYATTFEANKPYIVSVPGSKWGDNWNLEGKEITFRGVNVTVPVTEMNDIVYGGYTFAGTYAPTTVDGWMMNEEGNKFVKGEGEVKGYNAYIATGNGARALRIIIDNDITDGITTVGTEDATQSSEVYNLNGMRVAAPQKGVYVKNGKKLFMK